MSWNSQTGVHYPITNYPYNSAGSFMEYFEGLTYEHVNFIFNGASHVQQNVYPSTNTSFYKFGMSDPGSISYYDQDHAFGLNDQEPRINEYRRPLENPSHTPIATRNANLEENTNWEGSVNSTSHEHPVECPRRYHNANDYQVIWQDNIDPDIMSYEELLELGETVGTQNRGLSQELISLLPVSKYKCGFFSRKKSRKERCVICQMEYKRGDRQLTLPCKHVYHTSCGAKWLSINKACPVCYTEVFGDGLKPEENKRTY